MICSVLTHGKHLYRQGEEQKAVMRARVQNINNTGDDEDHIGPVFFFFLGLSNFVYMYNCCK